MADKQQFDESTRKELETFLENEQAQSRLNQSIHMFTSMCWDKCITSTPSNRFARGEESCMANCVERFLDTSLFMVRKIEGQRQQFAASQ